MAASQMFDNWYDAGKVFTEDQVKGCDPKLSAAARANALIDLVPVVQRRSALGDLPVWWEDVAKAMTVSATYYLFKIEAPRLDVEALNSVLTTASKDELKALTLRAHQLGDAQEFLDGWKSDVGQALVTHVSLGRRCLAARSLSGWKKAEGSMSNQVGYAIVKELLKIETLAVSLAAFRVKAG
jgi:hypothetical protein